MKFLYSLFVFTIGFLVSVSGHSRWRCPKARDWNDETGKHIPFDNTGNKNGPCGPYSGKYGMGGIVSLVPNSWQTLTWEESVAHKGAPFRISILDQDEVERVVLLDHIPHNENAAPIAGLESTYTPYTISVFIPDVSCVQCSVRVLYFMTDKTVNCGVPKCFYHPDDSACSGHTDSSPACAGAPNNNPCRYAGACFSNYHSCFDATINGTVPIDEASFSQPLDWPYVALSPFYGLEVGNWTNAQLQGIPAAYNTQAGTNFCT